MNSFKTAISRRGPSVPLLLSLKLGIPQTPVLDWGCGKGSDSEHLRKQGFEVFGYDPHFQPQLPTETCYQYGQCFYVLNVIPGETGRVQVLQEMRKFLAPKASILVATRSEKEVLYFAKKGNWEKVSDGWQTSKGTFQKGLSEEELSRVLSLAGFTKTLNHSNSRCTCIQAVPCPIL